MLTAIIITVVATLVVVLITLFIVKGSLVGFPGAISKNAIEEGAKVAEERTKKRVQDERSVIKDLVDSRLKESEKYIEGKKDFITEVVTNLRKEVTESQDRLIKSDKERVSEFSNLKSLIEEHKGVTEVLRVTTDNLRKILSNNQLRGSFGQEVAEDLLKIAGFVKGQNYISQTQQESKSSIPDFTVILPDQTKINVDVKFPFAALQKWQQTEDKEQQKLYLNEFKGDIKKKLDEVTTRDYINPEENTVDFVIMFIPNEMIFSFIYEKFPDLWHDALKNKVVMCGPFSFTAILRMVQKSYDSFKYQKDLFNIIGHIRAFEDEYSKFSESLNTLGQRLQSAGKQYEVVSGVRDRALNRLIDKIKTGETLLEEKPKIDAGDIV